MPSTINLYLVPPLLTLLVSLWLGSASFFKTGELNQRNILFSAMFFLFSLPAFAFISHHLIADRDTILSIERIIHFFYVYLPIVYLMFFHTLLEIKRGWMIIAGFVCSILFSFTTPTEAYFYGLNEYDWGCIAKGGPAFMLFGTYAFVIIVYTFCIFLQSLRAETNPLTRRRNKYFLSAVGLSAFLTLCNIPAIAGYDVYPAGNFAFIPLSLLGYAALKYRLLSFRDFINKITYLVATLVLILIPNILIFLGVKPHLGHLPNLQVFLMLMTWVFANSFYLFTVQPKINSAFHKTRINLEKAESLFLENIFSLRKLESFEQEFSAFFNQHLLLPGCNLFLATPQDGQFQDSTGRILSVPAALQKWMLREKKLVDFNLLAAHPWHAEVRSDLLRLIEGLDVVYLIPVVREDAVLALVFLPEKENYQPMTGDEVRFFNRISGALAVSLANTAMFQRITDLKDDLEKRTTELSREISQREQLEEQLSNARKMEALGTLAGGVAHDLNNILSGIVSYPELVLDDIPAGSPLYQPLLDIKDSGEKAAAVVEDLLTLARRGVPMNAAVDLNRIVTDYLTSPEHGNLVLRYPKIALEADLAPELPAIMGSAIHLSKALMNLVVNAFEAIQGPGEVRIATTAKVLETAEGSVLPGRYLVLTVTDNGVGIHRKDLRRIYEPFYTKKKMGRSGSGLGMAVVWGTVEDHKGIIVADSEPGQGTTFTLYFQMETGVFIPEIETDALEEYRGDGESVLIVDDVENQRKIAAMMLEKLGYCPAAVASGEEALAYLKAETVDLLLLDMILATGMDGLDTYRKIREIRPGQRVVIASGYSESERVRKVQALGAGAYIKKPYLLRNLGQALKTELAKSR
ncbi:MAG: response regulator [Desulfobacterales bacterium]|nr:response regulator [Desulfobacterales bacterium]